MVGIRLVVNLPEHVIFHTKVRDLRNKSRMSQLFTQKCLPRDVFFIQNENQDSEEDWELEIEAQDEKEWQILLGVIGILVLIVVLACLAFIFRGKIKGWLQVKGIINAGGEIDGRNEAPQNYGATE